MTKTFGGSPVNWKIFNSVPDNGSNSESKRENLIKSLLWHEAGPVLSNTSFKMSAINVFGPYPIISVDT